jgi:hypothetical protein
MDVLDIGWLEGDGPQDIVGIITSMIDEFFSGGMKVAIHLISSLTKVARVTYILLVILGMFLYFTHLNMRLGKSLILGGGLMAFTFEYIVPYLLTNVLS